METNGRQLERIDAYASGRSESVTINYHPCGKTNSHHTHDFYEINYVLSGSITEVVSGRSIPMQTGDAILMHPGVFHVIRDDADAVVLNILIRPQWLFFNLAAETEGALGQFATTADSEEYTEYLIFHETTATEEIGALIRASGSKAPSARLAAEGAFLTLLATLSHTAGRITVADGQDSGYRRFAAILSYLYENIRTVSVSELAARFGYSEAHLSRLFRRYTGEPPTALIKRARLARATALLWDSDAPIHRIAAEAGFPCAPHFHRLFKSTYGMTPEEYRNARRTT